MRIIDRLTKYLQHRKISAYSFERACNVANGYLKKQQKGKGSIGSDIIVRIHERYPDLSLSWLLTGTGDMLQEKHPFNLMEEDPLFHPQEEKIQFLSERINLLQTALADKEKIILLLEAELKNLKKEPGE